MRYISLCSGIEAASVAWQPLGWQPMAFAEIDPFCCNLLGARFGHVPNFGDITQLHGGEAIDKVGRPDVLIAGTPCQSFSVAGKRLGLDDPRGNVTLHFLRLVGEIRPEWIVWENVPGVLSIDKGDVFGEILATLDEFGYGVAWRVLDAQHFGVPQRRRRVFLVGHRGDWRGPAEVLFDTQGSERTVAPGGETRTGDPGADADGTDQPGCGRLGWQQQGRVAATLEANYCRMFSGSDFENMIASTVSSKWSKGSGGPSGDECQNLVAYAVRTAQTSANGIGVQPDVSHCLDGASGQAVVFEPRLVRNGRGAPEEQCPPLKAQSGKSGSGDSAPVVVFQPRFARNGFGAPEEQHPPLTAQSRGGDSASVVVFRPAAMSGRKSGSIMHDVAGALTTQESRVSDQALHMARQDDCEWAVRRFTPRECERLQGFPDDWTLVDWRGKPASNTQRYKAIGNSMAVPVVRWIGERINLFRRGVGE